MAFGSYSPAPSAPNVASRFGGPARSQGLAGRPVPNPVRGIGPNTPLPSPSGFRTPVPHPGLTNPIGHPTPGTPQFNALGSLFGQGGQGGQPPPAYLDATYLQNVAQQTAATNNQINALNEQQGFANTDLQSALARLGYQQPRDELALEEGANRNGSLYSSVYSQKLGDLNYNFAGQEGGLINNWAKGDAARQSQITGLGDTLNQYTLDQQQAAALRASQLAAKNPALGAGGGGKKGGGATGANRGGWQTGSANAANQDTHISGVTRSIARGGRTRSGGKPRGTGLKGSGVVTGGG